MALSPPIAAVKPGAQAEMGGGGMGVALPLASAGELRLYQRGTYLGGGANDDRVGMGKRMRVE